MTLSIGNGDSAAPQVRGGEALKSPTVPLSAACAARLGLLLLVTDFVIGWSALVAMSVLLFPLGVGDDMPTVVLLSAVVVAGLEGVGHALGIYDASSTARLRAAGVNLLWPGLLGLMLAMIGVLAVAGPAAIVLIAPVGVIALAGIAALRVLVAWWLARHPAAYAERTLLIGTAKAISDLLSGQTALAVRERWLVIIAIGAEKPAHVVPLTALEPRRDDTDAMLGDFWRLSDALSSCATKMDRVLIASAGLDDATLAATLRRVEHLPFEIALVPPGARLSEVEDPIEQGNCVVLRRSAITYWGTVRKRALDIVLASIFLIILAPVMLFIAALIRRESAGPALFRQDRWGWNNQPFTVFKFRTMWSNASASDGSVQATRGDKRITPIGAFLRKSSLDELPQLLNVLNGTMSLVGPRPHPVELNLRYLGVIDRYAGRHRVLPGITGLAQVNGFRGETSSPSLMQKRVEFDLEYIRTHSLWTDILILLKTVSSVVRGANAY
jgi:exopolysaccharide biosynthesis polyprenyl glycosylphosphotransferase